MRLQDKVYETYKTHVNSHLEENRIGAMTLKEAVENSPLNRERWKRPYISRRCSMKKRQSSLRRSYRRAAGFSEK